MSQYVSRPTPVINATFSSNAVEGQVVKFVTNGVVTPITADTDASIGVALAAFDSASVGTIAVKGGGVIVKAKLGTPAEAGASLWPTGSTGFFISSSISTVWRDTPANSGSVSIYNEPFAYALETGTTNDLIDVVLA